MADQHAEGCAVFIDYKERDFIFFWQKYHMYDHAIGLEDPAEMEAPRGEWDPYSVPSADGRQHGIEKGWTLETGNHNKCSLIPN